MRIALSLLTAATLTACAGQAPPDLDNNPDAGDDDPNPTSFLLFGQVLDYFGGQIVEAATVETDGLSPNVTAQSAADGRYDLDVTVDSSLYLVTSKDGYRPTRNRPVTVGSEPINHDVYAMTEQDVRNQYTLTGAEPLAGTAVVIADLLRNDGTPLEGIPLENVQLLDGDNQPVTTAKGPFFFNAAGSVDPAVITATAFQGRSRAAFLDVPPGTYTLSVKYTGGMGQDVINTSPIVTVADGGTLAVSGGMGNGGDGGGMGMGNVTDPSFAIHIYPKLQRAGAGGLGCANCHTLTGPAAVLKFDEPAAAVLTSITTLPGVIAPATPADSLLLKRPLYEAPPEPQDHANATFLTTNDADYKLFLLWITNGAKP